MSSGPASRLTGMETERVTASTTIEAAPKAVFAVLADPSAHADIDGTGWVRESLVAGAPRCVPRSAFSTSPVSNRETVWSPLSTVRARALRPPGRRDARTVLGRRYLTPMRTREGLRRTV
jgi:hypothetical protein